MNEAVRAGEAGLRANDLYWGSDRSVTQIAEDLDLSKGTLYGLIQPLGTRLACPRCETPVTYPNRTAKEKGLVSCPACGHEDRADALNSLAFAQAGPPRAEDGSRGRRVAPGYRAVAGAALLGFAAGIAIGAWYSRR